MVNRYLMNKLANIDLLQRCHRFLYAKSDHFQFSTERNNIIIKKYFSGRTSVCCNIILPVLSSIGAPWKQSRMKQKRTLRNYQTSLNIILSLEFIRVDI